MMMWQPIETAPRNQTFLAVLNCAGEQTICTMRWPVAEAKNSRPDSKTFHVERVTHWMPLPDPPVAQTKPLPSLASGDVSLISEGKTRPTPSVPKKIGRVESGFKGMFLREAQAYKRGWNECIGEMLAAASEDKP